MTKMTIKFIAYILLVLVNTDTNALTIVDNYCNDKAQLGAWEEGIINKRTIGNIVAEFDPEHAALVSYLDKLPVRSTESLVLRGMKVSPQLTTKIGDTLTGFQWDISGVKSNLSIILKIYKGCISQISLMDSNKKVFYNRDTKLPTQP